MISLSLDPACSWHLWLLTDLPVACCLSGRLFLPGFSFLISSSDDATFSIFLVCACNLWILTGPFLLTALEPGTWRAFSPDKLLSLLSSLPLSLPFPNYSRRFPNFFTSLLSSPPYSCHFPYSPLLPTTRFNSRLRAHPHWLHVPNLLTSLVFSRP